MFFRVTSDTSLMRSVLTAIILILTVLSPTVSIAESEMEFKSTYFDRNSNGLDDRMEELINNGTKQLEKFSWEKCSIETFQTYKKLI